MGIKLWMVFTVLAVGWCPSNCSAAKPIARAAKPAAAPAAKPTVKYVTLNGKMLSSDIRVIDGQAYVPLADVTKALGATSQLDTVTCTMVLVYTSPEPTNAKPKEEPGGYALGAKGAVESLAALASVVKAGVSKSDYATRKASAMVDLDRFTNEYGKNTPIAAKLTEAMAHYSLAGDLWDAYFSNRAYKYSLLKADDPIVLAFLKTYPEMQSDVVSNELVGRCLPLSPALSRIWARASQSVEEARKLLPAE